MATVALLACLFAKNYWDTPRAGANGFNAVQTPQWFSEARAARIELVRLTFTKWKGEGRDFLIGNADHFERIPPRDLAQVRQALRWAHRDGIKVVLTPLSLPGARWRQQNGNKSDARIWTDRKYHHQAAEFWRQLAAAVKDEPALVGYDILNEPAPDAALKNEDETPEGLAAFAAKHRAGPADVNELNRTIWKAIRRVDRRTPIIVEPLAYASADAMPTLMPLPDPNVLYSFHGYGPWPLVSWRANKGNHAYPGPLWDRTKMRRQFDAVDAWAKNNRIPANRIFVGEIGADRRVPGCAELLRDTVGEIRRHRWHWAFYAFREDEWDGMDYELGSAKLPPPQSGVSRSSIREVRKANPLWRVLSKALSAP